MQSLFLHRHIYIIIISIALTFDVENVDSEYERLIQLGVEFSIKPTEMDTVKVAVLNDTCGNNIQLVEDIKQ